MYLSDLQELDVINIIDGSILGSISDVLINCLTGQITAIVVESSAGFLSVFNSGDFVEVPWNCVVKVGSDVILVDFAVAAIN